jgi:hypothetical protein
MSWETARMITKLLNLWPCKTAVSHSLQLCDPVVSVSGIFSLQWHPWSWIDIFFRWDFVLFEWIQNNWYWSTGNPHLIHDVKVCVWCPLSVRRIVGSVFYSDSINCKRYALQAASNLHPVMLSLQLTVGEAASHTVNAHILERLSQCSCQMSSLHYDFVIHSCMTWTCSLPLSAFISRPVFILLAVLVSDVSHSVPVPFRFLGPY